MLYTVINFNTNFSITNIIHFFIFLQHQSMTNGILQFRPNSFPLSLKYTLVIFHSHKIKLENYLFSNDK